MHANYTNLYSFESPEPTLSERKKIIQIESLHVEILTIKVKVENKYIKCIYLATSDSIHVIFGLLDSP